MREFGEAHGTRFEFECYDVGHLYTLAHFLERGLVKNKVTLAAAVIQNGDGGCKSSTWDHGEDDEAPAVVACVGRLSGSLRKCQREGFSFSVFIARDTAGWYRRAFRYISLTDVTLRSTRTGETFENQAIIFVWRKTL